MSLCVWFWLCVCVLKLLATSYNAHKLNGTWRLNQIQSGAGVVV